MKDPSPETDNTDVTVSAPPIAPPPLAVAVPPALPAAPAMTAAPSFSEDHLRQLAAAHAASRKIRRAVNVARMDGWGVAVFGLVTFLFGLNTVSGLLLGGGLCVLGVIELRAAARLRRFETASTRTLGFNQIALGCVLMAYALWRLHSELNGTGEYAEMAASDPAMSQALQPFEDLTRMVSVAIYGGLMAVAVFAQGGLALYYFTRAKFVRAYVAQTPEWVIAVQKAGSLG